MAKEKSQEVIVDFNDLLETKTENIVSKRHKLAVVVPFRDRFDELLSFVPHISKFLENKSIDFNIYIINQRDKYRFNRAALVNVGFLSSMKECDYMVMHDVDLLPLNNQLDYSYPQNGLYHVSTSGLHPEYDYKTFIGGILIVNKKDFLRTNGMSNRYWGKVLMDLLESKLELLRFNILKFLGWGKEDDEFYLRLKNANLNINRPNVTSFKSSKKFTFFHNHEPDKRPRDKKKFAKQRKESLKNDNSGLNNLQYKIMMIRDLIISNYPFQVVDVELICDKLDTHWCNMDYQFIE